MQTCDPLKARQQFKILVFVNWATSIGTFVLLAWILSKYIHVFIADILAIAVVFCLFFFFLKKRILRIKCDKCSKIIETNTPWICGLCGTTNRRAYDNPFVSHCSNKNCAYEPKAYKCHHVGCGHLIFLSLDKSELNFARCVNAPEAVKQVAKQPEKNPVKDLSENVKTKSLQVEAAKLDLELKGLKAELEPPKPKTPYQELEEYYMKMMGNEVAAKKWRSAIDAEFKDNEDERKKRHLIVDQWLLNRLS